MTSSVFSNPQTLAGQRVIDRALGIPRHLYGWHVSEFIHFRGTKKAKRLVRWAIETGGPSVIGFPLDRARPPARVWDAATCQERRIRPVGAKPATVILLPPRLSHRQAA